MTTLSKKLTEDNYVEVARQLNCEVAAVKAVTEVESRGSGFDPEGFPKTLFEGHWFHKLTNGKFSSTYPTVSYPKWTRTFYGKSWSAEKQRLTLASELDREAALMSASWGLFQIMGFNYKTCGFDSIQDFVNAMCHSEGAQLKAFANFVINNNLSRHLIKHNWAAFAERYNGPGYASNKYDTKLAEAYIKFKE